MSILTKNRTLKDFEEKLTHQPTNTRENVQAAINNFKKFASEKHNSTLDEICNELIETKKSQGEDEYEHLLYGFLQDWIDWNVSKKAGAYTIRTRFSIIRNCLYHLGVKTNPQDIKQLLKFPKKITEEKYPLKKDELKNIILSHSRNPKRQALYLACSSSGMRIGEALQIKKKDIDFSMERPMIKIQAEYTKTKSARTTFVSKECLEKIMMYYKELEDNDSLFTDSKGEIKNIERNEQTALSRSLKTLGYTEKYSSNGFYKITTHSFRAYFFTLATRKHDENYAHKMTGHGGYLMQYDRLDDKEKLKLYLELEPELVVFQQTKNELEIEKLKLENDDIQLLREEVRKLREFQAKYDEKIVNELKDKGILVEK